MSAALCFTPWYEPMGLPNAWRILAYSTVMSRTFWAPPHISAQRATHARSSTRSSGFHPRPGAPSSASGPRVTSVRVTSQSFRVWSIVGSSLTSTPRAVRGTRERVNPAPPAAPPGRAAHTIRSDSALAALSRLVHCGQQLDLGAAGGAGHEEEAPPVLARAAAGARRHHDAVGGVGVGHEELGPGQRVAPARGLCGQGGGGR